jgi:hypothetical protein
MKLYTEEQVMQAYKIGNEDGYKGIFDCSIEELSLTPIELPSDEEILNNACKNPIADDFMNDRQIGFVKGCKWMKEQILNQNK